MFKESTQVKRVTNSFVIALVAASAHAGGAFNPSTQLLTLDRVILGANTYRNVSATINSYSLLNIAGGTGWNDSFDPGSNTLVIGTVTMQGKTFNNVIARINSYTLRSAEVETSFAPGTPVLSLYAGTPGISSPEGSGSATQFLNAKVWGVDAQGNVYVRDYTSLKKIPPNKDTTRLINWMLSSAGAYDLAVTNSGDVYFSTFQNSIWKLGTGVLAGPTPKSDAEISAGTADGQGGAAGFNAPAGLAIDNIGNVFVADRLNHTIRKITPGGLVSTFAGVAGASGSSDGKGALARFNQPQDLAIDANNNLYLYSKDFTIRKITPDAIVTTLAGKAGVKGWADGKGEAAQFSDAIGIAVSALGNIYLADYRNHAIRKITQDGVVTTIVGKPGVIGYELGAAPGKISYPQGVAVFGNALYFASWNTIVRVSDIP